MIRIRRPSRAAARTGRRGVFHVAGRRCRVRKDGGALIRFAAGRVDESLTGSRLSPQTHARGHDPRQQDGPIPVGRLRFVGRQIASGARSGIRRRGSHHHPAEALLVARSVPLALTHPRSFFSSARIIACARHATANSIIAPNQIPGVARPPAANRFTRPIRKLQSVSTRLMIAARKRNPRRR